MRKELNPEMFDYYKNFTKQVKVDIKKRKMLGESQARMILRRVRNS